MAWVEMTVREINTWVFLEKDINRTVNMRKLLIKIWVVQKFFSQSGSTTFSRITLYFAILFLAQPQISGSESLFQQTNSLIPTGSGSSWLTVRRYLQPEIPGSTTSPNFSGLQIMTSFSNDCKIFTSVRSGACFIKLITAVIFSFRNKVECLSLASLSSLV